MHRGRRALERERHVGELVLDRLERADRHVELLALLRVARAPCRRCGARCRPSRPRATRARGRASAPTRRRRAARASSAGRVEREQPPGEVDRRDEPRWRTARRRPRARRRAPTTAMRSTRSASSTNGCRRDRRRARRCRSSRAVVARSSDGVQRVVARNGPGAADVAGLLEEQAAGPARGPAPSAVYSREVPPQRLVRARIVDVRAHERGRALAFEQLARRVAQQLLVVGEREVHRAPQRLGRPSTRWAMMLRWISELPPAIVFANDMKKPCTKRSARRRARRR